jgi:hypothetical protein
MMFGRRRLKRVRSEAELNPFRERFCQMFQRLEREHGITHYLAHNMTVTPRNLDQVAGVIRDCRDMGFRMFSCQPAAFVGNARRWKDDYRVFSTDAVWAEIERGAGARLHWRALLVGDAHCNRTAHGGDVGDRYVPLLDEDDPRDARVLTDFLSAFGGMDFQVAPALLATRTARAVARHPRVVPSAAGWARRAIARAGGVRALLRTPPRPMTFVMHAFMDARVVRPAWEAIRRGEVAVQPEVARPRSACGRAFTPWLTPRTAHSCPPAPSTPCSTRRRTPGWPSCCPCSRSLRPGEHETTLRPGHAGRRVLAGALVLVVVPIPTAPVVWTPLVLGLTRRLRAMAGLLPGGCPP